MTFVIDKITPELSLNQLIVLQHKVLPELVLCKITDIKPSQEREASVLFLRSHIAGTQYKDSCYFILRSDGQSLVFCQRTSNYVVGCLDYELIGEEVAIPEDLDFSDAIDYVMARI